MSDSDVKAIALFFFFTMLDEKRAIYAATEACEICLKKIKKLNKPDSKSKNKAETKPELQTPVLIVAATQKIWEQHRKRLIRGRPQYSTNSGWQLPGDLDLGVWKEFQKKAPEEELLALVWSQILKFSDETIALGLEVTQGTVRFRVGRALRKLGGSQQPLRLADGR